LDNILLYLTDLFGAQVAAAIQISVMIFVAFLIGAITILSGQRSKISKLRRESKALKSELSLTKEEYRRVKNDRDKIIESYNLLNGDNKKLVEEYRQLKKELENLKAEYNLEKNKPSLTPLGHREEIKKLKIEADRLKEEIDHISQQNQKLRDESDALRDEKDLLREEYSKLKGFVLVEKQTSGIDIRDAKHEAQRYKSENERLMRDVESLTKAINRLNNEIEELKKRDENLKHRIREEQIKAEGEKQNIKLTERERFEREKQKLLDSIGVVDAADKDDLQQIRGIGPFIEKKLHKIGVYSVRQIANFTKDDVERATVLIKYFPGRIERDNWIFQAKEIVRVQTKKLNF
jgi:predicted flap endonuclease-1-like 5' DNA nuclease